MCLCMTETVPLITEASTRPWPLSHITFHPAEFISVGIVQILFTRTGTVTKTPAFHKGEKGRVPMATCGVKWMLRLLAHVGGRQGW